MFTGTAYIQITRYMCVCRYAPHTHALPKFIAGKVTRTSCQGFPHGTLSICEHTIVIQRRQHVDLRQDSDLNLSTCAVPIVEDICFYTSFTILEKALLNPCSPL